MSSNSDIEKLLDAGISSSDLEKLIRQGVDLNRIQIAPHEIDSVINGYSNKGGYRTGSNQFSNQVQEPWIEIIEQPRQRGLRFRYECEGRSAGSIPGEHNTAEKRTFPTVKIHTKGAAVIVVSTVTKDPQPRPHPHALVGKDCAKGVCTIKIKDCDKQVTFPNLGIQCAKKKEVAEALALREQIRVDPYQTGFKHKGANIDLNVVKLCFQAFLPDKSGKFTRIVPPVCTQPIFDKKAVNDLVICRVDRHSGSVRGGDEVFLLCEKVQKEDIQVRFYEENEDGVVWEAFGDFGQSDVHRQVAIVFKTPQYRNPSIQQPQSVFMQLKRPSDEQLSDPKQFMYMVDDRDPEMIESKRRRKKVLSNFTIDGASYPNSAFQPHSSLGDQKVYIPPTSQEVRDRLKAKATRGRTSHVKHEEISGSCDYPVQTEQVYQPPNTYSYASTTHTNRSMVTIQDDATLAYNASQATQTQIFGQEDMLGMPTQSTAIQGPELDTITFDSGTMRELENMKFNSNDLISMSGFQSFPDTDGGLSVEMASLEVGAHESVGDDDNKGTFDEVNKQIRSLNQS